MEKKLASVVKVGSYEVDVMELAMLLFSLRNNDIVHIQFSFTRNNGFETN